MNFDRSAARPTKPRRRPQGFAVREVPAAPALLDALAQVHRLDRRQARLWPWGRTTGWRAVKNVMGDAGLADLAACPKGLRHGFGVHVVMSGVLLNLIQKWLGHADIATTAIYINVLDPEERIIAARMW